MHHDVGPNRTPGDPAALTARSSAPGAGTRHRRQRTLVALLAVALAAVVLRSPQSVLSLVGTPTPSDRHGTEGHAAPVPVPRDVAVDSVMREVAGAASGGHGVATAPGSTSSGDSTDGHWGASQVRPGGHGILLEELRGGWRVEAGVEEAVALAVIAAHAWADARARPTTRSGSEPGAGTGPGPGPASGTGVIVTVEAVERPAALHAVVTLLVVVGPDLHRIAVPIAFGAAGPALAGAPWSLPPPTAPPSELLGTAIDDPELIDAARRALEAVGIDGQDLIALETTSGWPFVARLEDDTRGHPWLRWHLDRFVVSGLPLRTGGGSR